jgi:proton-coupled amino acid transporter
VSDVPQVLALENNMKTPASFGGSTGVLNTGMVAITIMYVAMGFFGYVKYGESAKGSVTLNLPQGDM